MRARNREINIFNMSLLDILTGMLGAFLFLMLGLLPYYAKVSKNKDVNPEELRCLRDENQELRNQVEQQNQQIAELKKQLEELQKIVKDAAGGPLTADQVQQLMDQLNQMRQQIDQLRNQLAQAQQQVQQARQQLQQTQQQLDQTTKDRDYWQSQQGTLAIVSEWDSSKADIDVLVMDPAGKVFSPKTKDKLFGKECQYDGSDSHGPGYADKTEGLLVFLEKSGDYLVFYRVPSGADPAAYANLHGAYLYNEGLGKDKGVSIYESSLGSSLASMARPGGLYAWAVLTYDSAKKSVTLKPPAGKLPPGVVIPSQPAPTPFPFPSVPSPVRN